MGTEALRTYLAEVFPQVDTEVYRLESVTPEKAIVRLTAGYDQLRPGGTVSGPTMMALADYALYAAILSQVGPVALAVTTSLSFNFLRKPEPGDLIGVCRLMKLGKRLAVGEVAVAETEEALPVCHAVGTYSIPADR
ncbi:MAG: PaaI family thioesterase [Pseudomonadota bacterium]